MQSHETKTQGRLLAVGDIHGCLDQLKSLMAQVAPKLADRVIFLGDYVDRGPDSAGVIDYLIEFKRIFPSTCFLRGNHEQMFIDYLDGHDPTAFLVNGGLKTLKSYKKSGRWPIPSTHRTFLDALLDYYETEDYIFVHAGLRPGIPLAEQDSSDLLWIRRVFINSSYDWGKTVVYGHTPLEEPLLAETRLGLDTGCVYGRQLTCCDVRTRQVWQA
ncbi:MAG: serine/threonine protein phosphatase [Desulfuromonadales bacterium]|nr:serine/threonine protein phosphatase [Desulfuromonadales bacterium]